MNVSLIQDDVNEREAPNEAVINRKALPPGVEIFRLSGPFFFGAAAALEDVFARTGGRPRVLILDMEAVPLVDATGAATLAKFAASAKGRGTRVIFCGVQTGPAAVLQSMEVELPRAQTLSDALALAKAG